MARTEMDCGLKAMPVRVDDRVNELVVIGDKSKAQLQRESRDLFVATIQDTQKARLTFALVSNPEIVLPLSIPFDKAAETVWNWKCLCCA